MSGVFPLLASHLSQSVVCREFRLRLLAGRLNEESGSGRTGTLQSRAAVLDISLKATLEGCRSRLGLRGRGSGSGLSLGLDGFLIHTTQLCNDTTLSTKNPAAAILHSVGVTQSDTMPPLFLIPC